jgi:hypothetical protein
MVGWSGSGHILAREFILRLEEHPYRGVFFVFHIKPFLPQIKFRGGAGRKYGSQPTNLWRDE